MRAGEFYVHGRIQSCNRCEGASDHSRQVQRTFGRRVYHDQRIGWLSFSLSHEWETFEKKLRALPLTNKNARTFTRFFVAGATNCELDRQGRVLVPQPLREFAGLEKEVVLTGNLNRIEIWSKEKWSENCNYDDMDSIAESMRDMDIII